MPQIIESYIRQAGPLQDWLEMLVHQAIHIHRSSKLRDEDEIYSFWPFFGINDRVLRLALFSSPLTSQEPNLQPDDSAASRPLRLTIFPLTRGSFSQGSLHTHGSTLPVNVLPLEPDV